MTERSDAWDTVQMPVNAFDPHFHSFVRHVLPVLEKRNLGVIAMKTLGAGYLLRSGRLRPEEGLRYAWSRPVDVVVSGMDDRRTFEQNIAFARRFEPMSDAERERLLARTLEPAREGRYEPFKTSTNFDGWYGRRIHGL